MRGGAAGSGANVVRRRMRERGKKQTKLINHVCNSINNRGRYVVAGTRCTTATTLLFSKRRVKKLIIIIPL